MAVFVHLTSHRNIDSIRRKGITLCKRRFLPSGVYAMPVTMNFYVSHQWLRELKRFGGGTIVGIYFRVPDDEIVEVGHYSSLHVSLTASQAIGLIMAAEKQNFLEARKQDTQSRDINNGEKLPASPEGYEVIIKRKIEPSEIIGIKSLPQVVGWRYRPGTNGNPPCACICCERGQYGIRKLMERYEQAKGRGKPTKIILFGLEEDSLGRIERIRQQSVKSAQQITTPEAD